MEIVKMEIEMPKEMAALSGAVAKIAVAVKLALADGWQPGTDIPAITLAALAELPAAIAGLGGLPAEIKADKGKLVVACALIADSLL